MGAPFAVSVAGPTRTDEVEVALIALLTAGLENAGVTDIAALTTEDLDEADDIIVQPPAARIAFANENFEPAQDEGYLDYRSQQEYVALVGASRPSTVAVERGAAQSVLESAKNALAGARLALPSNPDGAIIRLRGVALFQMKADGTWYAVRFAVESFTQFTANIGTIR
ncbi:MAG: hypothetical protein ACLP1Y_08435 [Candidatus Acidiferrales bacterium]